MVKFLYKGFSKLLASQHIHIIKGLNYLGRPTAISLNRYDFVRLGVLELIGQEINDYSIQGDVAELGVYKGGFAKDINFVFKHKKFYLFDTFAGFHEKDLMKEKEAGFNKATQNFANTSSKAVLEKMPFPSNCIIREGRFPETFMGLENEKFSFVSIDADLHEPILNGLIIFYAALSPGGFIIVHDYNNYQYPGAKKAVREFCDENHISYLPIPDSGGSVIIKKPL